MIATVSRKLTVLCLLLCLLAWAMPAAAFYPLGGFDSFLNLRLQIWKLNQFDTNDDGQVTGNEGLETFVEVGPLGFTQDELDTIDESMAVWENVSTSFAQFAPPIEITDPLLTGGSAIVDLVSYISIEVPPESDSLGEGVLGVTYVTFAVDDEQIELGGVVPFFVSAGTIIDIDIVIAGIRTRPISPGLQLPYSLKGTLVHELGHFLGLGHTPTNDLAISSAGELVESASIILRDAQGERVNAGVTPTMFPLAFLTQQGGIRIDGAEDLAPDDISGISWMYPRGDQSEFFPIQQVVRSQTRNGFPSLPLPGALVTAWLDQDADPNTPRVPVFSTMAGLYVPLLEAVFAGRFSMQHLWKAFEVEGFEGQVAANYTFTMSPLNGLSFARQAPLGYTYVDFAGIEGSAAADAGLISVAVPSEVFNEAGNVFDISNKDVGTPMVWNFESGQFVSADTGRTLEEILGSRQPMFGDAQETCPFNLLLGVTDTGTTTDTNTGNKMAKAGGGAPLVVGALRGFRDNVLLRSRSGSAVVDAYYTAGPFICAFLLNHGSAFSAARTTVLAVNWLMEQWQMLAGLLGFLLVGSLARKLRGRLRAKAAAAALLLAVALFSATPAHATLVALSTPELAAAADVIITGTVVSAEVRKVDLSKGSRIYTDVTIEVQDVAKGAASKQSTISFSILGGRSGGLMVYVPELPRFAEGEQVLLYLQEKGGEYGYVVAGGVQGKLLLAVEENTGEKVVLGAGFETMRNLAADKKAIEAQNGDDDDLGPAAIHLDDYLDYLREIIAEQAEEAVN